MISEAGTLDELLATFAQGGLVMVADSEQRENEGDLMVLADRVSAEQMGLLIRHTSGIVCVAMDGPSLDRLELKSMVPPQAGGDHMGTAFTVSVDASDGVTTGVSAADRVRTVRTLANPSSAPSDLMRPGHVFPLRADPGGLERRPGHTEAAVELARLCGARSAVVLAELTNEDGTMARGPEIRAFCACHEIPSTSVEALRERARSQVTEQSSIRLPTQWGEFTAIAYTTAGSAHVHLALVMGELHDDPEPLVRIHSECMTGDLFGSRRCDCGGQLRDSLREISDRGVGALVYMRGQEGRGIGLIDKLKAYALQDQGLDTVDANLALGHAVDTRTYAAACRILVELGLSRIRLITNNPKKVEAVEAFGLEVDPWTLPAVANTENLAYLQTKQERLNHTLSLTPMETQ